MANLTTSSGIVRRRPGARFVARVPDEYTSPRLVSFMGFIFITSPNAAPAIVHADGRIEKITFLPEFKPTAP